MPPIGQILAGDFSGATNGLVATLDGSLLRTSDAAATFEPVTNDLPPALVIGDLRAHEGRWIAATNSGIVFTSNDDGHHWRPDYSDILRNAANALDVQSLPTLIGAGGMDFQDDGIFVGEFENETAGK